MPNNIIKSIVISIKKLFEAFVAQRYIRCGVRTFRPMPFQPLQFQPLQFQPFTHSTACNFNRQPFQPPQIQPLELSSNQLITVTNFN